MNWSPTSGTAAPRFAGGWEDQAVDERTSGVKRVAHPTAGLLTVAYDVLRPWADGAEQRVVVLTPADAETEQRLRSLVVECSWRAAEAGVGGLTRARSARAAVNGPTRTVRRPAPPPSQSVTRLSRARSRWTTSRVQAASSSSRGTGPCRVPQHCEQPPARLSVRPLIRLPPPRRTVVCGLPRGQPRAQ